MNDKNLSPARNSGVLFQPWVGPEYGRAPKILILGESHYGTGDANAGDFTRWVVTTFGLNRRDAFMTKVAKVVMLHPAGAVLSSSERATFWNSVAFYNYVQRFVAPGPRVAPTEDDWIAGVKPFRAVVEAHTPHLVVALGFRLWEGLAHLGAAEVDLGFPARRVPHGSGSALVIPMKHPSGRGFRYVEWQKRVRNALSICMSPDAA